MRVPGRRNNAVNKWARLALKAGLLLTDAKLWSALSEQLWDRMGDLGDSVRDRYEDAADRVHEAGGALRGESHWVAPTVSFIGGVGLGVGLGLLLAPASGEETRSALRDKVVDVKNKVSEATGSRFRSPQATGTEGY